MKTSTLKDINKPTVFIWGDFSEKKIERDKFDSTVLKLYDDLFNSIYRIVNEKKVSTNDIFTFNQCLISKTKILWETAGSWLMQFSHYFEEFERLGIDIIQNKSSTVRLHIIQSIWTYLPTNNLLNQLLKIGLSDTKEKVRLFAIFRINSLDKIDFLDELKKQQEVETSIEVLNQIKNTISLFELGYYVEPFSETSNSITYKDNDRIVSFFLNKNFDTFEKIKAAIKQKREE